LIPDGADQIKLVPISEEMLLSQAREEEMRNGGPQAVRCAMRSTISEERKEGKNFEND
jgi:hypothetical protein